MDNFTGVLNVSAGEFKTIQELVQRELATRVFDADATVNAERKAYAISSIQATRGTIDGFRPDVNIYMMDAYKGNNNGVIDQAAWAAGDFTGGQADNMDGGVERKFPLLVDFASKVIYAPADAKITIDLTLV